MKSFLMSEKDKIRLTYKDFENDEISVTSDDDLVEAYNIYFMKKLIKFFVHYSGMFSQNATQLENNKPLSSDNHDEKIETEVSCDANPKTDQNLEAKPSEKVKLYINSTELENIFSELFSSAEVVKKIRGKLTEYMKKNNSQSEKTNEPIEYSIDTDYQKISESLMTTLNGIVNSKFSDVEGFNSASTQILSNNTTTNTKSSSIQLSNQNTVNSSAFLNQPLTESFYEKISVCKNDETDIKKLHAMENKSLASTIIKNTINHSRSLSQSKSLAESYGIKLVLRYENGMAKFVAVPAYSQMEESKEMSSNAGSAGTNSYVNVIPEESVEEKIDDIVLSLKRTPSKEEPKSTVSKAEDEFSKAILKKNLHDIDDDLSAPYDVKQVKQFEKGITESIYERLE